MYTQVELPPLIPPFQGGISENLVPSNNRKSSSLPLQRGGLGWGNSRTGNDLITCVYTVALLRGGEPLALALWGSADIMVIPKDMILGVWFNSNLDYY